jgi:phosphohistidine phosphatase SixA
MFVVLTRHAEREPAGADPGLSVAGHKRAKLLASMLADSGIDAIFISQFVRTKQTATPLASHLGITPVVLPSASADAVQAVMAAGGRVLVVGHSDSVPELIAALGGPTVSIGEAEFDRLFLLHVNDSTSDLFAMKYGSV